MKRVNKIRLHLSANESPTFSNVQLQSSSHTVYSPMTDLALNLSDTKLANSPLSDLTPRRRLSLNDNGTPTPTRQMSVHPDLHESSLETKCALGENRLLKNAIKFPGYKEASFSRVRGFSRRINLNLPLSNHEDNVLPLNNKENCESDMLPITSSPVKLITASPSKLLMMRQQVSPLRPRQPLEDQDPNSQDSGYGTSYPDKDEPCKSGFRFAEPYGLAPRRHLSDQSPMKENITSPRTKFPRPLNDLSSGSHSGADFDDGFLDLLELEYCDDSQLPSGLNNLLSKPIIKDDSLINTQSTSNQEEKIRPSFRRSLSLVDNLTPNSSRARSCLFKSTTTIAALQQSSDSLTPSFDSVRSFKRPDPPCENVTSPSQAKRRKSNSLHIITENSSQSLEICSISPSYNFKKPALKFKRCFSESEATIKKALHRSVQDPDLIGDFTKPYILPLIEGQHQDLKTISANTLAELMDGQFNDTVDTFTIVDCRYPYEFEGGHIRGAKNIYTKDQVLKDLVDVKQLEAKCEPMTNVKRKHIMVFHCEFSSERGPNLYRFLRNSDRDHNKECYPALYYPELYLLEGGYKNFYEHHSVMCEPQTYLPMRHKSHEDDLRHFRAKSKSWNGDNKSRLALRSNLKRSGI